jgi:hypothetical protein
MKSEDLAQTTEMIGSLVNLLGEVVGTAVGDGLAETVDRLEQSHALDRDHLAQSLAAVLDQQATRFQQALERQAENFAAAMARQAELQTENLRTILRETLKETPAPADSATVSKTVEVLADLQETLRLGFGEVRTALDRHHRELMDVVRAEVRPLAKAAVARLTPPRTAVPPATPSPSDSPGQSTVVQLRAPPPQPASNRPEVKMGAPPHGELGDGDDPNDPGDPAMDAHAPSPPQATLRTNPTR